LLLIDACTCCARLAKLSLPAARWMAAVVPLIHGENTAVLQWFLIGE
jgi:hypothetical protein